MSGPLDMIAANVRALRAYRGLKQAEVAKRAGVSAGYLSRIERGTAAGLRMDIVERIIKALDGRLVFDLVPTPPPAAPGHSEEGAKDAD